MTSLASASPVGMPGDNIGFAPRTDAARGGGSSDAVLGVVALLAGSGLFLDILPPEAYDLYWLLYLLTGSLIVRRLGLGFASTVIKRQPLLCIVLMTILVSALWSPDPWLTMRWAVALIGTTLIGLFVGERFGEMELLEVLAKTFLGIILITLALMILIPGYALEPFDRGYLPVVLKGAARHRNALGAQAALMVAFVGAMLLTSAVTWMRGLLLGGLAAVILILAQSMTAIVCAVISLALLYAFWGAKRLRLSVLGIMVAIVALAAVVAAALLIEPGRVAEMLGRDADFTERDIIWADALRLVAASPLLGHGYGSVWGQFEATSFHQLASLSWAPHAHSGYLQLATEVGVPVTALAILYLLSVTRRALAEFMRRGTSLSLFALAGSAMCLCMNSSETWLVMPYEIIWSIYVAMGTALMAQHSRNIRP